MVEFNQVELLFINKLLSKVKYSEIDYCELNNFANSPISNEIMKKINSYFEPMIKKHNQNHNAPSFSFEYENYVGKAIRKRLEQMPTSSFEAINDWQKIKIEKFAKDILGGIDYKQEDFDKLVLFIKNTSKNNLK